MRYLKWVRFIRAHEELLSYSNLRHAFNEIAT